MKIGSNQIHVMGPVKFFVKEVLACVLHDIVLFVLKEYLYKSDNEELNLFVEKGALKQFFRKNVVFELHQGHLP